MKFAFRIKALHKGGILKTENSRIIVKDADEVVFLLTADTDYKINFNPISTTRRLMSARTRSKQPWL